LQFSYPAPTGRCKIRKLQIPSVIEEATGRNWSPDDLAVMDRLDRSSLRLLVTARRIRQGVHPRIFRCNSCRGLVYPREAGGIGRPHWVHRTGPNADRPCEYDKRRILTPDEINGLIFRGRQESAAHRDLVDLLYRLAKADPNTAHGIPNPDSYYKPEPDKHGLYPDVRFDHSSQQVVLEAQLATISLHTINLRRTSYDAGMVALIWVTRNFDPRSVIRASVMDIAADQRGMIFDIPAELVKLSETDSLFRLRRWYFKGGEWISEVVSIADAIRLVVPRPPWHADFKRRWIEVARSIRYMDIAPSVRSEFKAELETKLGFNDSHSVDEIDHIDWLWFANIMISIEYGQVLGYHHEKIVSCVHSVLQSEDLFRAFKLFKLALEQWLPELAKDPKILKKFSQADTFCRTKNLRPWTRKDRAGRLREVLFPDWKLAPQ
jgi:hypothetical protein